MSEQSNQPNPGIEVPEAVVPADAASKGLPMTAKWDPEKLEREIQELRDLQGKPFGPRAVGYIRRTGPGLLQSAMTLGAGSATASVVAGASFGYKLLWVQPVAMFLGVMMLAALSNIVLTTGERPYRAFGQQISKLLVFLWALGTIMASIIWHFPQYGLAAGAGRDLGAMAGLELAFTDGSFTLNGYLVSFAIGLLILCINTTVVWSYGSSARGIRLYEWFLRIVIGMIVLMFAIVVMGSLDRIEWGELGRGFIGWYGIPGWQNPENVTLVLGMLGAAVGINMTFLYPYSLLAKGWGSNHKTLARWDLGMSMFLPFTLVTSLVIVGMTVTGVYTGEDMVQQAITPLTAAQSLHGILGEHLGRIIFNLGLIAMTCTAISTHMVVCGFTLCEMFGLEYSKTRFRLFAMAPAIGLFGVVARLPFWFPVAASAICFAMLPVAYLIFIVLNNKRSYIGDAVSGGAKRLVFNFLLLLALLVATIGSVIQINNRVVGPIGSIIGDQVREIIHEETAEPLEELRNEIREMREEMRQLFNGPAVGAPVDEDAAAEDAEEAADEDAAVAEDAEEAADEDAAAADDADDAADEDAAAADDADDAADEDAAAAEDAEDAADEDAAAADDADDAADEDAAAEDAEDAAESDDA